MWPCFLYFILFYFFLSHFYRRLSLLSSFVVSSSQSRKIKHREQLQQWQGSVKRRGYCKFVRCTWKSSHSSKAFENIWQPSSFPPNCEGAVKFWLFDCCTNGVFCCCSWAHIFVVYMCDLLGQSCVHSGVRYRSFTNINMNCQDKKIGSDKTNWIEH